MDIRRRAQIGGIKKTSSGGGSTTGGSYTVNLNGQWEKTTAISNPDSTLYDGVYRSSSNFNVNSGVSIMYITIKDCSSFKMYIRSYAEYSVDYVMVSQLDKTINGNTTYSDTTLVKAHTRGNQQSGTALSSYTLVEYTGITSGEHTITVVYRKDGSVNSGDDRGYVLIEKSQAGSGDSGSGEDDEGGSSEGPINIDNYLTIEAREDGLTASLSVNACEYCVNGNGNWKTLSAGTATESINSGQTLSFRGNLDPSSSNGIGTFTISKKCNLLGNCMSLLFGDDAVNNNSLSGKNYAFRNLFSGCTTIIQVSDSFLPATTLASNCYHYMFYNCTSLTTAPELPATTLASYCYYYMFYNCTSLTTAPELPATRLANYCYYYMFYGCSGLTTAPELPATTLASYCYHYMFYGTNVLPDCSNIDFTSNTVVSSGGLSGLFAGTKVTDNDLYNILPINPSTGKYWLPATSLASYCYYSMFDGCTSLTVAPELPATTLASYCYQYMFFGCIGLTTAPELPATTLASYCYQNMFNGCTNLTTAPSILPATTLASNCYYKMFKSCSGLTVAPELPATRLASSCYHFMFENCTSLTVAPELPATSLASYCYNSMFSGCSSLTTAPELPATTLDTSCYHYMFSGCSGLTVAPELPATTLAGNCYNGMFYGCSGLTSAPELPATKLATSCYYYMFYGCTNLTTAPSILPATTLVEKCYQYMFEGCTSLTVAPELPATTLASYCYYCMFYGCSNLNYIKMLATDISASRCLLGWLRNVSSTGTFVKNPAMTTLPTNDSGIPSGWTVVDDGEESGGNLITFYVAESLIPSQPNFIECKATEGMTWGEWIDSEYNTLDLYIDGDLVITSDGLGFTTSSGSVHSYDTIINGEQYYKG